MKAVTKALLVVILGATLSPQAMAQERPANRVAEIVGGDYETLQCVLARRK